MSGIAGRHYKCPCPASREQYRREGESAPFDRNKRASLGYCITVQSLRICAIQLVNGIERSDDVNMSHVSIKPRAAAVLIRIGAKVYM
jgi:hypothetical protein